MKKKLTIILGIILLPLAIFIVQRNFTKIQNDNKIKLLKEYIAMQSYTKFLKDESIGKGECYIDTRDTLCLKITYDIANDDCVKAASIFNEEKNKRKTNINTSGEFDRFRNQIVAPYFFNGSMLEENQEQYCFMSFFIR